MPKTKSGLTIRLNLLKPQGNPEKITVKFLRWLLSSGRYIFVFVEALVLIAFITRFKLDADLAAKKEAIEEQIPYIESLKPYEILIRNTQLKLATIESVNKNSPDWANTIKKIADQTPSGITLVTIRILNNIGNATIHITGESQNNADLNNFIAGLKEDPSFYDVSVANIGLEQGLIKFTIDVSAKDEGLTEKKLSI